MYRSPLVVNQDLDEEHTHYLIIKGVRGDEVLTYDPLQSGPCWAKIEDVFPSQEQELLYHW
jgi:hypothetical protein